MRLITAILVLSAALAAHHKPGHSNGPGKGNGHGIGGGGQEIPTSEVPEPGTVIGVATGLAGIAYWRRRRVQ